MKRLVEHTTNVILQVTLIVTFISIFFFLYVSTIESNIIVRDITDLVDSFKNQIEIVSSDSDKKLLRDFFGNMKEYDMDIDDNTVHDNNEKLKKYTEYIIAILFGLGISVTILLILYFKLDWKFILKESIIGLCVVAVIEYLFLTFFAQKYKSLDPNRVKLHLVNILQNYAKS